QEYTAVAVGGVLPVDAAARRGMAAPAVLLDVVEGLVLSGGLARVGERRIIEGDQLDLGRSCLRRSGGLLHRKARGNDRRQHTGKNASAHSTRTRRGWHHGREPAAMAGAAHVTPRRRGPARGRAAIAPRR